MSHREISEQAEALFGSLHQLQALMTTPLLSRRGTIAREVSLSEVPELKENDEESVMLSPKRLSMACSILEESLRVS